ncbi:MAG: hypothetical protein P1V51_19735 [Deltaproteobacteria bacterium]|nr:hypothetical protein [Deltaproteobacteria bacterium]
MAETIKSIHPEYKARKDKWADAANLYYLEGGFADGAYLVAHGGEVKDGIETDKFKKRKELAWIPSYGSLIIDSRVGHLFKQEISRTTENPELEKWLADVDGNGTRLNDFLRTSMKEAMIYDHVWVFMDLPRSQVIAAKEESGEPVTKADVKSEGIRPYIYAVNPTDVLDWDVDRAKKLRWVKVRETHYVYGVLPLGESDPLVARSTVEFIRIWTRQNTTLYRPNDKDGGYTVEGVPVEHNLGVVPGLCLYNKLGKMGQLVGRSELEDIVPLAKALYNRLSEATELFRNQSFSILTIPVQSADEDITGIKVGTDRALPYDASLPGGKAPAFISADSANATVLADHIGWIVEEIHRIGAIKYMGGVAQSGVAWAFDWEMVNHSLTSKADLLKEFELKLAALWFAYETGSYPSLEEAELDYQVQYPTTFSLADPQTEAELADKLSRLKLPADVWKEFVRSLVRKVLPDLSPDVAGRLDDAITAWDPDAGGVEDLLSSFDAGRVDAINGKTPSLGAEEPPQGPGTLQ